MATKDATNGDPRLRGVSYSKVPSNHPTSKDQMDLKVKYITTAVIYYCNISLGVSVTYLPPILIDFRNAFHTDMQTISLVFTVSLVAVLVSVSAFGVIFNYVNRHAVITLLLFILAIALILTPHSPSLTVFFVLNALAAISSGGYITAQVVWVIEIWKEAGGPYIQAQHFFFAVGCMIPPLIFAPFLSNNDFDERSPAINNSSLAMIMNDSLSVEPSPSLFNSTNNDILSESDSDSERQSSANLIIPCAICGSIIAIGAALQLIILLAFRSKVSGATNEKKNSTVESPSPNQVKDQKMLEDTTIPLGKDGDSSVTDVAQKGSVRDKIILIALSAALVGSFQSMEAITGQFLPSFTHFSELHFSQAVGAKVQSAYTMSYTAGRLAGIFIILKVVPQRILFGNFIFVLAANVVLLMWGMRTEEFMWIGSVLLGIGYSTGVPSVFAYIQTHLEITNSVGAILMVCGMSISAVFPIIVGAAIVRMPAILLYLNFSCVLVGTAALAGILCFTNKKKGMKGT